MGASASETVHSAMPPHMVTIERPFAVGKFEVTFDEWTACVRERGCVHVPDDRGWGRGSRPAIYISWDDAMQYVRWLSMKTGKSYRLLSEAEWEYVARAGATTAYAYGDHISPQQANYYTRGTTPVGSYAPNAFGVYDMHGNVWEWTADCWNENYNGAPVTAAAWTSGDCSRHVFRGGSWDDYPWFLHSAERSRGETSVRLNDLGFRVARTQ
jgi:formylglycine-generating enzyme required for sulfatase activity